MSRSPRSSPAVRATRLDEALVRAAAEDRAALVAYLPVGYPSAAVSLDALRRMARTADVLELGVPHSDPVLDGPVIRDAAARALAEGFRMRDLFAVAEELTASSAALLVMSYWAPVARYGAARFARDLADAGGSAVLVPDVPADAAGAWQATARAAGLRTVNLVPPRATGEELERLCAATSGMVYAPATTGTTGSRGPLGTHLPHLVDRLRAITALPIGVGIGVSTVEQAARIAAFADAVIIGSPLIRRMRDAAPGSAPEAAAALAREFADALRRPATAARPADRDADREHSACP